MSALVTRTPTFLVCIHVLLSLPNVLVYDHGNMAAIKALLLHHKYYKYYCYIFVGQFLHRAVCNIPCCSVWFCMCLLWHQAITQVCRFSA